MGEMRKLRALRSRAGRARHSVRAANARNCSKSGTISRRARSDAPYQRVVVPTTPHRSSLGFTFGHFRSMNTYIL